MPQASDRETFIKIAEEINAEGYSEPTPKPPYENKHYASMWRCPKCLDWWGTGYWGWGPKDSTKECPGCANILRETAPGLGPWSFTTRGPFHITPDSLPMLYSAMVTVNRSDDTENPYSLPASLFVGALAELTGDALQAIDQDLARFYVQYGSFMWSEFVSGDQGVVDKRLENLPFREHHNAGIKQAHNLLNRWFEGFEL